VKLDLVAAADGDGVRVTGSTAGPKSAVYSLYDSSNLRGLLGLAEGASRFSSDSTTGDIVLRAETGKLLTQTGNGASTIATASGNIGIGTATPATKLEVGGDGKFTGGDISVWNGNKALALRQDSSDAMKSLSVSPSRR